MRTIIESIQGLEEHWGLKINIRKSQILTFDPMSPDETERNIRGIELTT